jgi:hypothetical protein
MPFRIAADMVLIAHFLFAAFAVFGGILVAANFTWAWVHIPVVLWSSAVNLMSWTCPLTPLEQSLRVRAGQAGYRGGFIQHYVGRAVYPGGMPRRLELVAGISVLVGNALVYAAMLAFQTAGSQAPA